MTAHEAVKVERLHLAARSRDAGRIMRRSSVMSGPLRHGHVPSTGSFGRHRAIPRGDTARCPPIARPLGASINAIRAACRPLFRVPD